MTNELMKRLSELPNVTMDDGQEYIQLYDAMETVKRALEQEPKYCDRNICMANEYNGIGCDECEVQEPTDENLHREREQAYMQGYEDACKKYRQEPKTGHWILADKQNKEDVENDNYRFICSECQCSDIHAKGTIVPYCWKCGCRMVEPQERIRNEFI